jgi:hypothetical protein
MHMTMRRVRHLPRAVGKIDNNRHQFLFMNEVSGYTFFDLRYSSLISVNHGHTRLTLKSASRYVNLPIS